MNTHTKTYLLMATASLVLFLCCFTLRGLPFYHVAYAESICYFALAWYCADRSRQTGASLTGTAIALCIGRCIVEFPMRIVARIFMVMDIYHLVPRIALMIPSITMSSIALAVLCYKEKRPATFFLAIIIIILLNSVANDSFMNRVLEVNHGMF